MPKSKKGKKFKIYIAIPDPATSQQKYALNKISTLEVADEPDPATNCWYRTSDRSLVYETVPDGRVKNYLCKLSNDKNARGHYLQEKIEYPVQLNEIVAIQDRRTFHLFLKKDNQLVSIFFANLLDQAKNQERYFEYVGRQALYRKELLKVITNPIGLDAIASSMNSHETKYKKLIFDEYNNLHNITTPVQNVRFDKQKHNYFDVTDRLIVYRITATQKTWGWKYTENGAHVEVPISIDNFFVQRIGVRGPFYHFIKANDKLVNVIGYKVFDIYLKHNNNFYEKYLKCQNMLNEVLARQYHIGPTTTSTSVTSAPTTTHIHDQQVLPLDLSDTFPDELLNSDVTIDENLWFDMDTSITGHDQSLIDEEEPIGLPAKRRKHNPFAFQFANSENFTTNATSSTASSAFEIILPFTCVCNKIGNNLYDLHFSATNLDEETYLFLKNTLFEYLQNLINYDINILSNDITFHLSEPVDPRVVVEFLNTKLAEYQYSKNPKYPNAKVT